MAKSSAAPAPAVDLKSHINEFKEWLNDPSGRGPHWQKEREDRLRWYKDHLAEDKIDTLPQKDIETLVKGLWASNIFQNKDYKVGKVIQDNGLEKLRASLKDLLFEENPITARWDTFRGRIKGLGPSSISEILTFFDPQKYALVNLKPYEVLPRIGQTIDPVTDGKGYANAIGALERMKMLLLQNGISGADFIITDFFIAYLFYEVFNLEGKHRGIAASPLPPKAAEPETGLTISGHEAAQAALLILGKLLNFDTYTADPSKQHDGQKLGDLATLQDLPYFASEKAMDSARKIDVVWVNGEWPECFFEVEQSTGVTPGLHRMYQVIKVDAKFFIIAPEDERKRFEREVDKEPYKQIKQKYRFRSYGELGAMYSAAERFRKTSDQFLK
jgi:hypothetical protein